MEYFIYNNKHSFEDCGLVMSKPFPYTFVNEEVELIEIEGRSGTLTRKEGIYKDIVIELDLKLIDMEDYKANLYKLNKWLDCNGINRLIDGDNLQRYYKVKSILKGDVETELRLWGAFKVTFICEPFLFDVDEWEYEAISGHEFEYYGDVEGEPIIKLYLPSTAQNVSIIVNDTEVQFTGVKDYIEMNTRLFKAVTTNNASISNIMVGNFPKLKLGTNKITTSGTVNKITIDKNTYYRG